MELFYADDEAQWIAVPVERLDPAFFDLRSGLAGDIVQACANYRIGLAVVGDVSDRVAASEALAAFVRESNRGQSIWFVADEDELGQRVDQRLHGR